MSAVPGNIFSGLGEELHHQASLAGQFHIDMALADAGMTACIMVVIESLDRTSSIIVCEEFHVAIHGLGRRAVHDDMNGASHIRGDEFGGSS
jgi:hypothetical protein